MSMQIKLKSVAFWGFPVVLVIKTLPANAGDITDVGSVPLEKGMATHSSILSWRIPWTEESDRLQPIGSQTVGHN